MKIQTLDTGLFKLDGGAMHGVVPKSMWQKQNPADEGNMVTWAMRCLLIEHGNYRILVDTGMGTKQDEKFFSHYQPHGEDRLEGSLARLGFTPKDITDVFLTHLHFDHCGAAVKRAEDGSLVPTFPMAKYWTNRFHWATATKPNAREAASFLKENILPLEEACVLRYFEGADGDEWLDDIRIRLVSGHTDAMMLPQIRYNGRTILFCADLIPSAAHVSLPWVMAYDMQPLLTLEEKSKILKEAVANDWILVFEHDAKVEACTLVQTERGVRVGKTGTLAELLGENS